MVGGGQGAFIGGVHRMAAALDGKSNWFVVLLEAMLEDQKPRGKSCIYQVIVCIGIMRR